MPGRGETSTFEWESGVGTRTAMRTRSSGQRREAAIRGWLTE